MNNKVLQRTIASKKFAPPKSNLRSALDGPSLPIFRTSVTEACLHYQLYSSSLKPELNCAIAIPGTKLVMKAGVRITEVFDSTYGLFTVYLAGNKFVCCQDLEKKSVNPIGGSRGRGAFGAAAPPKSENGRFGPSPQKNL